MDAPRRCTFNPLVTAPRQCILPSRAGYPSISAIQTLLYPVGRASNQRTICSLVKLKTLRSKAKVERAISFVPGSPHLRPTSLALSSYAQSCSLSLFLRFPEYHRYRLSSQSLCLYLSLSPVSLPLFLSFSAVTDQSLPGTS